MPNSNRLKAAREAAGMTQKDLSLKTGLAQPSIVGYEKPSAFFADGEKDVQVKTLVRLARAIGCPPSALLYDLPPACDPGPALHPDQAPFKQLRESVGLTTLEFGKRYLAANSQHRINQRGDLSCTKLLVLARAFHLDPAWLAEKLIAWWERPPTVEN